MDVLAPLMHSGWGFGQHYAEALQPVRRALGDDDEEEAYSGEDGEGTHRSARWSIYLLGNLFSMIYSPNKRSFRDPGGVVRGLDPGYRAKIWARGTHLVF